MITFIYPCLSSWHNNKNGTQIAMPDCWSFAFLISISTLWLTCKGPPSARLFNITHFRLFLSKLPRFSIDHHVCSSRVSYFLYKYLMNGPASWHSTCAPRPSTDHTELVHPSPPTIHNWCETKVELFWHSLTFLPTKPRLAVLFTKKYPPCQLFLLPIPRLLWSYTHVVAFQNLW